MYFLPRSVCWRRYHLCVTRWVHLGVMIRVGPGGGYGSGGGSGYDGSSAGLGGSSAHSIYYGGYSSFRQASFRL